MFDRRRSGIVPMIERMSDEAHGLSGNSLCFYRSRGDSRRIEHGREKIPASKLTEE